MHFMFLPLEHKIHIFSPSCNILYLFIYLFFIFFIFLEGGYIFTLTDYEDLFSDEGVLWDMTFKQLALWELLYKMYKS